MFLILLQFKDVNYAHSILSDEQKKEVYDQWGSRGISLAESMGEEVSSWLCVRCVWLGAFCALYAVVCGWVRGVHSVSCTLCVVCIVCGWVCGVCCVWLVVWCALCVAECVVQCALCGSVPGWLSVPCV